MKNTIIRYGGFVGEGLMAFFSVIIWSILIYVCKNMDCYILPGIITLVTFFSPFTYFFGCCFGEARAKCSGVGRAFSLGGFFGCLVAAATDILYFLITFFGELKFGNFHRTIFILFDVNLLMVSLGAMLSGIPAIAVRDIRQFGRIRSFPQFTIGELLIVTTLSAVLLGIVMSIKMIV
jgi:hypothetical protein